MVNTLSVGAAVTPTAIHTYLSHYFNRRPLHQKPTAHISYHEGLELVRRFLHYASFHTVDELQAFTSQWVPAPHWVLLKLVEIPGYLLVRSAKLINAQLGAEGIKAVGGKTWWQWRREGAPLKAEWIEMRKDHDARKQLNITKGDRIMLYVHGGAYFFGSVDEHRYQMQRHARKLKARVIAPKYRLAPQFPFPCGLHDCMAVYLYLLEEKYDPSTIILAGDSAGGGMVLSMLVTLRDQGIRLPAGAILISPWVDLTHSFPSLAGDGKMDYIPPHGFVHKPSMSWPPPNADDLLDFERARDGHPHSDPSQETSTSQNEDREARKEAQAERVRGYSIRSTDQPEPNQVLSSAGHGQDHDLWVSPNEKYSIGPKSMLSVQLENAVRVEIKDQIQMYAPNHLLTHPLVSPALQPSLGGLPPLMIQTGGGELLRDEQIYIAHKAAHPLAYLPPGSNNQTTEDIQAQAARHRPTNVQLQVWDDLCHVAPTLSFTRPAKHMYRSIAQFGAWVLARAQHKSIDIIDDDDISVISTDSSNWANADETQPQSSSTTTSKAESRKASPNGKTQTETGDHWGTRVGRAGDPLPPFQNHMIRQRIDRHGWIYPLAEKEELEALKIPSSEVGVPKIGPVTKWMKAQEQWNNKFAKQKIKIQRQRIKDMKKGFEGFEGEIPPPTALAGRRVKDMKAEKAPKRSWGMSMWSGWGSSHDKSTIEREEKANQIDEAETTGSLKQSVAHGDGATGEKSGEAKRSRASRLEVPLRASSHSRSHSRHSAVTDRGQATASLDDMSILAPPVPGTAEATRIAPERKSSESSTTETSTNKSSLVMFPPGIVISDYPQSPATLIPPTDGTSTRPTKGGIAYPFSLKVEEAGVHVRNASILTLQSLNIATPPAVEVSLQEKQLMVPTKPQDEENIMVDKQRSNMERCKSAGTGAGLFNDGIQQGNTEHLEKCERPLVERFEIAQDDLNSYLPGRQKE